MTNHIEITKLPNKFIGKGQVKGFRFTQIERTGRACIYRVDFENMIYYEVFKIRIEKMPRLNKLYERYPSAKCFGLWAWTYRTYDDAVLRLKMLEESNGKEY